ncbi:hypothetical protein L596_029992 [Steinernema carpocapsae]|uniref:Uncharacterized protein n=1 Tax=Steinernema carpocapsae TaxID=34508 RepID=A0A4U5LRF1_STECR|nr:hypothetical protein L596_029992 [Steinernema carpocapsae]
MLSKHAFPHIPLFPSLCNFFCPTLANPFWHEIPVLLRVWFQLPSNLDFPKPDRKANVPNRPLHLERSPRSNFNKMTSGSRSLGFPSIIFRTCG